MIIDIKTRINCDKRGKITTGKKSDKGFPMTTDHFVIDEFPELIEAYGTQPKKLVLFFPTDNILDFFDCNYISYGKETKIRQCDGQTCIHRINETIAGVSYEAGQESGCICHDLEADDKKRCRYVAYFKAWIADPKLGRVNNPLCYLFQTTSKNSGDTIFSELEKIKALNHGVLRTVPFGLSVEMVSGREQAKKKFPIWHLQAIGLLNEIRERTDELLMPTKNKKIMLDTGKAQEENVSSPWDKPLESEE